MNPILETRLNQFIGTGDALREARAKHRHAESLLEQAVIDWLNENTDDPTGIAWRPPSDLDDPIIVVVGNAQIVLRPCDHRPSVEIADCFNASLPQES